MPNGLVPPTHGRAAQRRGSPAVQLLPAGCGANKGPVGAVDRVSLAAWGRGGLAAGEEGLFRSFLIDSLQRGLGGSQLSGRGRGPSPTRAQ